MRTPEPPSLAHLMEDEVRAVLEGWQAGTQYAVASEAARQLARHTPLVIEAAEAREVWTAVRHALWCGLMAGMEQARPVGYHLERHIREMEPDAERGRKNIEGARKSWEGRNRPDRRRLAREVEQIGIVSRGSRSWTAACDRVGERHGMNGRSLRRYREVRAIRW